MIAISSKESLDLSALVQRLREQMPQILRAYPAVQLAYLYGSAAQEATTPLSDIDIALVAAPPLTIAESLNAELDVYSELMHRANIRNADVRLINQSSLLFRGQVIREGILVFAREEEFRVAFETHTRNAYLDFKPRADRMRRSLLTQKQSGGMMVNREKIENLILQQREYLKHLRRLAKVDADQFVIDPDKTGSARYYFVAAIEICVDIGNHIISAEHLRAPSEYADVFRVLGERKIFPPEFVRTLEQMVGFRNRLVHVYDDVNDNRVHEFLNTGLVDFDRFQDHILKFLE